MPPTCSAAGHRLNRLSASYGETQSSATSSGRQRARPIRHSKGCCEPTVLQMVAAEVRRCAMTWQSSAWPDDPDVTHPTDIPQSAGVRRRASRQARNDSSRTAAGSEPAPADQADETLSGLFISGIECPRADSPTPGPRQWPTSAYRASRGTTQRVGAFAPACRPTGSHPGPLPGNSGDRDYGRIVLCYR